MAKKNKMSKAGGGKKTPKGGATISLAMMVKNEEEMLPRALESAKLWVDEIVVVDTGSTDRTVEIAESYGAKIYHHPWEHSFSIHRNQTIGYCTCTWILILDADEELDQQTAPQIRELAQNQDVNCFLFKLYNDVPGGGSTFLLHPRLFRNLPNFHYEGAVHNAPTIKGRYKPTDVKLIHYGYNLDPASMEAKHQRRITMLEKAIENDPQDYKLRAYLAQSLASHPGSREQALGVAKKAVELADEQGAPASDFPRCYYPLMGALYELKKWDELIVKAYECLDRMPNYPDPYLFLIHAYAVKLDWVKTAEAAQKFFMMQEMAEAKQADWLFAEIHTTNQFPAAYHLWTVALGQQEDFDYAESVFERLLNDERGENESRVLLDYSYKQMDAEFTLRLAELAQKVHPEWDWVEAMLPKMRLRANGIKAEKFKEQGLEALEAGDMTKASEQLGQARELIADDPDVHIALARVAHSQGKSGEAANHLIHGLNVHPGHPWGWRSLGEIALAGGDQKAAATYLQRYLRMQPNDSDAAQMLKQCEWPGGVDASGPCVAESPPKLLVFLPSGLSVNFVRELAPHLTMHRAWGETLFEDVSEDDEPGRWETLYTAQAPSANLDGARVGLSGHPGLKALDGRDLWNRMSGQYRVGLLSVPLAYPAPPINGWAVSGYPGGLLASDMVEPVDMLPRVLASGYRSDFVVSDRERQLVCPALATNRVHMGRLEQIERNKIKLAMEMPAVDVLAIGFSSLEWVQRCFNLKDPRCFGAYQHIYGLMETCLAALRPENFAIISHRGYDELTMAPQGGGFYCLSWHTGENAKSPATDIAPEIMRLMSL